MLFRQEGFGVYHIQKLQSKINNQHYFLTAAENGSPKTERKPYPKKKEISSNFTEHNHLLHNLVLKIKEGEEVKK